MTQDPPEPAVDEDLLPPGPGLLSRWLVAAPLTVLTTALPMAGQLALGAWTSLSFHDTFSDLGEDLAAAITLRALDRTSKIYLHM